MSENNKKYLESVEVPYYDHLLFDYLDSFKNSHCMENIFDDEICSRFFALYSFLEERVLNFSFKEPCYIDIFTVYRSYSSSDDD